jgi:hypothetical protein
LFVDTSPYIDAIVLDNFGALKQRRENESLLLADAVKFWVMAAPTVRQVILDCRSDVTQRMKKELYHWYVVYNSLLCAIVSVIFI